MSVRAVCQCRESVYLAIPPGLLGCRVGPEGLAERGLSPEFLPALEAARGQGKRCPRCGRWVKLVAEVETVWRTVTSE